MNPAILKEWLKLTDQTRRNIFAETSAAIGLPDAASEKDWWVVRTIDLVFNTSIAPHTVFKGGTSLSKAWGLIDRFSEDIDLALDRKLLGFDKQDKEMNSSRVRKLREQSFQFISEKYFPELKKKFFDAGLANVTIQLGEIKSHDQDPLIIEIYFPTVTEPIPYLQPRVLIEVGSRSMIEPFEKCSFTSFVGEHFKGRPFADELITIPTVRPERTFLEKIFLLHEEFQQPVKKIKVERKSRHLYDLEKLMDTGYAKSALGNKEMYQTIVDHRETITPLRGIDYANHTPDKINLIPPDAILDEWEKDYVAMRESMFNRTSLPFNKLMGRLHELKARINRM
ncbi:MAG: nucleotidyl transferase AbiEii/AbiGii toxin family protein [Bacteroidales bacterium]|nr:nucleotidyl transferase AbiEii/AbiGii toxin family protein [Bacteroidales bacterium]